MIQVPPASGAESSTVESRREVSLIDSGVATEARESCIGHQGSYEDRLRSVWSGGRAVRPLYAMGGYWARSSLLMATLFRPGPPPHGTYRAYHSFSLTTAAANSLRAASAETAKLPPGLFARSRTSIVSGDPDRGGWHERYWSPRPDLHTRGRRPPHASQRRLRLVTHRRWWGLADLRPAPRRVGRSSRLR